MRFTVPETGMDCRNDPLDMIRDMFSQKKKNSKELFVIDCCTTPFKFCSENKYKNDLWNFMEVSTLYTNFFPYAPFTFP